jgi:hypothetical protein
MFFACAGMALIAASSAHAAGTPEQRRACRKDAMKLCREFVPDVPKITACMEAHKAQLTPLCRQQFK